ncbi:hypothetical protein ACWF94_37080 [Streptomyces sp. NPDC055078]
MRGARAGVFAVSSAGLATLGHRVESGEAAAWGFIPVAAVIAFLGAPPWTWRIRSFLAFVVGTCAAQFVLHEVLTQTTPGRNTSSQQLGVPQSGVLLSTVLMLGVHTLAALAAAVLLRQTDDRLAALPEFLGRIVATVCATVARWLGAWRRPPCPGAARFSGRSGPPDGKQPYTVLAHVVVRRGPPGQGFVPTTPCQSV